MKADVCLISPPTRAFGHYRPPLGLMYLASYLEKRGIKTAIIDAVSKDPISARKLEESKEKRAQEIIDQIGKKEAKFACISCYTPELNDVIDLAGMIKKQYPERIIIVGGVHPTLYPNDFCYPNSPVDYVVIGEGEATMADLVKTLKWKRKPINKVRGIAFFSKRIKKIVRTEPQLLVQDLDSLPLPAFNKVDMAYYTRPNPYSIRGVFLSSFYILTSRGCPSRCTFCVAKKLRESYKGQQYVRFRSAKNILKEVLLLKKKYRIDSFYIIDDFFAMNQRNTIEFCKLLLKHKANLLWGCETKVTALKEETVKLMRKSGCVQIDFGVESGSQRMLDLVKKDITIKTTKDVFALCKKYGIRTFANILINLPGETKKDLNLTLKLLDKIKPTVVSFNVFTPYLGTEIYDNSPNKLKKSEYHLLARPPTELIKMNPKVFRFNSHNLDVGRFAIKNQRKYNPTWNSLKIHFSLFYLKHILRSESKWEYLSQIKNLLREYAKQKFGWV
jgi:radical SAM superfamily enzyme YgiQ (UPF0313 family)